MWSLWLLLCLSLAAECGGVESCTDARWCSKFKDLDCRKYVRTCCLECRKRTQDEKPAQSPDEQCKQKYGDSSSLCPIGEDYGDKMCQKITCWNKKESKCSALKPQERTSCDDKMWCINGKCVQDSRAPSLDKNCRFGDYSGVINTEKGYLNCRKIANVPGYCDKDFYRKLFCCQSCSGNATAATPDEQCKDEFGESSSLCPVGEDYGDKMCQKITCWNREKGECSTLKPQERTSCDDKKWCINGKCVQDSKAPSLDKNCRFGDYTGFINTDYGFLSCAEIARYPGYCNKDFYRKKFCCKSCSKNANVMKPVVPKNVTRKGDKDVLTVEILVLVDLSSYLKWYQLNNNNREKTIHTIKKYFSHLINGVKASYEELELPGRWITCSLAGIYIEEKSNKLDFMERYKFGDNMVDEFKAIDALSELVKDIKNTNNPDFPDFDVATLFTKYKLSTGNGYGYVKTACSSSGVSLVIDDNFFFSTHTATHEIGHNLGLHHDGAVGCEDGDSYVMSATNLGTNVSNLYKFSKCSVRELTRALDDYDREGTNCLLNVPTNKDPLKINKKLKLYPGLEFSLDEQCRVEYGNMSSLCPIGDNHGDTMCKRVTCWYTEESACWGLTPADGTPCGDKKWCIRKKCVHDERAPVLDKNCPFGEYSGVINTDRGFLTCPQIASYPEYCNKEFYKKLFCCTSCSKITKSPKDSRTSKNPKIHNPTKSPKSKATTRTIKPGCTKDKATWCHSYISSEGARACEYSDVVENCCRTCSHYLNN